MVFSLGDKIKKEMELSNPVQVTLNPAQEGLDVDFRSNLF